MSDLAKRHQEDCLLAEGIYFNREELYELARRVSEASYLGDVKDEAERLLRKIEGREGEQESA